MWNILLFYYLHWHVLDHCIASFIGYLMMYNYHKDIEIQENISDFAWGMQNGPEPP